MTDAQRRRLDRIRLLWRELAQRPNATYHTATYQALMRQIRAEVEAFLRDDADRDDLREVA